jgi:hypothetical protein
MLITHPSTGQAFGFSWASAADPDVASAAAQAISAAAAVPWFVVCIGTSPHTRKL